MPKGRFRRTIYAHEIIVGLRLAALGEWWAAHAAARLRRLTKFFS